MEPSAKRRKNSFSENITDPEQMISCFNKSEEIHFNGIKLSGNEPPMKIFMKNDDRIFSRIVLEDITLSKDHDLFWKKLGKKFTQLVIRNCFFPAADFIVILKNLTNLTKLTILDSPTICTSIFIDIEKNNKDLFVNASKLTSFNIDDSWTGMGSPILFKWLSQMPNITEFEIKLVQEDLFIIDCLKLWEKKLKSLRIKNKICVKTRNKLFELEISQLEVFQIESVINIEESDPDNEYNLIEFISKQKNLLELSIGICDVGELFLETISQCASTANVKVLGIYNTGNLETISSSTVIGFFDKVNKLYLSVQCFNSLDTFMSLNNENLTHLTYYVEIDDDETRILKRVNDIPFYLMYNFMNLTYFDVNDEYISGVDIQSILRHLTGLTVLKVNTTHTLSDFAVCGKGNQYPKGEENTPSPRKGPFYQIGRIKNLIELDIQSADNQFTDLALNRISKLKKLKIINLSNYTKITICGIEEIILSCHDLEQITITGCPFEIMHKVTSDLVKRDIKVIYK